MKERVFTVGSLIPGRLIVERPAPIVHFEKVKPQAENIIVEQNSKRFTIQPAKGKLLDVAISQGKQIQYKCRKGTCGQCKVKVVQAKGISSPNEQEQKKLKDQLSNGYRLACQAEIL